MRETPIVGNTLDALNRCVGVYAWRNNTGAGLVRGSWLEWGDLGSADIIGCYRGRFFGVEVKAAWGRQSDEQKKWQAKIEAVGGLYVLARSPAQALLGLGIDMETHPVKPLKQRVYPR